MCEEGVGGGMRMKLIHRTSFVLPALACLIDFLAVGTRPVRRSSVITPAKTESTGCSSGRSGRAYKVLILIGKWTAYQIVKRNGFCDEIHPPTFPRGRLCDGL